MKAFVKLITHEFDISPSGTHVAAIAYSTRAQIVFKFNTLKGSDLNEENVSNLIDGMPHQRGFTFIDRGLRLAARDVFIDRAGMRVEVPKVSKSGSIHFVLKTLIHHIS